MGKDKFESKLLPFYIILRIDLSYNINPFNCTDEELIKWGWPEDVWFHVDKLSSAHVYLRLNPVSDATYK